MICLQVKLKKMQKELETDFPDVVVSKELLESISDKYISIRTLLNEKDQRGKDTQGMESNNLQKREVQI